MSELIMLTLTDYILLSKQEWRFSYIRWVKFWSSNSNVTMVNNTVLYTWNLLRGYILSVLTTLKEMILMSDDRYVKQLDYGISQWYAHQNVKLHTINIYNFEFVSYTSTKMEKTNHLRAKSFKCKILTFNLVLMFKSKMLL